MLTSKKSDYGTPKDFFAWLDESFHFTIDLAAGPYNTKHARFYGVKDNSLHQSWEGETGFLNPPYGRGIAGWMQKSHDSAVRQRAIICMLLPARVGARWWRRYVTSEQQDVGALRSSRYVPESRVLWLRWEALITGVYFHHERLDFEGSDNRGESAPFDAAVVMHFSPNRARLAAAERQGSILWGMPR